MFDADLGDREEKTAALPWLRLGPDLPAVAFKDALANGQANSRSWQFVCGIESLEHQEDAFLELRIKTDAIVTHRELPSIV